MLIAYFDDATTFVEVVKGSCDLLGADLNCDVEFRHVRPSYDDSLYLEIDGRPGEIPVSLSDGTMVSQRDVDELTHRKDVIFLLDVHFGQLLLFDYGLRLARYLHSKGVDRDRIMLLTAYPEVALDDRRGEAEIWADSCSKQDLYRQDDNSSKKLYGRLFVVVRKLFRSLLIGTDEASLNQAMEEANIQSPTMKAVLNECLLLARGESPVLLLGDTGVGKTFLAEFIHNHSPRKNYSFIDYDLALISPNLIRTELTGSRRGDFTDAVSKPGLIGNADQGTLFLDEIANSPLETQAQLLTLIGQKRYRSGSGSEMWIQADVRLITATNADLAEMVENGTFRKDLFFRLAGSVIQVPSLKDRAEDIPSLVVWFLKKHKISGGITPEALEKLTCYSWPGNVKQLETTIQQAGDYAQGEAITPQHIKFNADLLKRRDKRLAEGKTSSPLREFDLVVARLMKWDDKREPYKKFMDALSALVDRISDPKVEAEWTNLVHEVMRSAVIAIATDPKGVLKGRSGSPFYLRKIACVLGVIHARNEGVINEFLHRCTGKAHLPAEWDEFAKNLGDADPRTTWQSPAWHGSLAEKVGKILEAANGRIRL